MATNICKLYGSVTTSTDGAASLDCVADGLIVGLLLEINAETASANAAARMEVSFASTNGFTSTDTRNSIGGVETVVSQATAAGVLNNSRSLMMPGLRIPVAAGERLYLHVGTSASFTVRARAWIYVNSDEVVRATTRRR
jgi:hypothetical protein